MFLWLMSWKHDLLVFLFRPQTQFCRDVWVSMRSIQKSPVFVLCCHRKWEKQDKTFFPRGLWI
jgi:hypothetical protein